VSTTSASEMGMSSWRKIDRLLLHAVLEHREVVVFRSVM
jgi:hypothetical protein